MASNPQYAGIPSWVVYFALDSRYDPREVWPAVQALGETKVKTAYDEDRLTLGRTDRGQGDVRIGILTHCPRCKRAFEGEEVNPYPEGSLEAEEWERK